MQDLWALQGHGQCNQPQTQAQVLVRKIICYIVWYQKKVFASFRQRTGTSCASWKRPGSNPGPWAPEQSVLPTVPLPPIIICFHQYRRAILCNSRDQLLELVEHLPATRCVVGSIPAGGALEVTSVLNGLVD
jgi:hypothetical protein